MQEFSDRLRQAVTNRCLDIAEALPAFRGGFIRSLQSIRQHHREEAAKLHAATRAPAGADFKYIGFRLTELFPAEEYHTLITGLRKLFPAKPWGHDQIDRFQTSVKEMFRGGWANIGALVRDKDSLMALQYRVIPELPEEVSRIEISVHKILPSAIVVAFDVTLTKAATNTVKTLHNKQYLPTVRFFKWMPSRNRSWARSESPAELAMQDAILKWQSQLHSAIERFLASYLSGFFLRSGNARFHLPVIDVFAVAGTPIGPPGEPLSRGAAAWMESLVLLSRAPLDVYVAPDLLFAWTADFDERPSMPYRFIETCFDEDEGEREFKRREKLDAMLPYLTFVEAISSVRTQLETLRIHVYRAFANKGLVRQRLGREMKLNDQVQKQALFISRLALELKDAKPWMKYEANVLHDLFRPPIQADKGPLSLSDALEEILDFQLDRVTKHLDLIAKTFEDYVSRRSLAVMYRLQHQVLVLAIIATLATVLGVLENWPQFKAILQLIRSL